LKRTLLLASALLAAALGGIRVEPAPAQAEVPKLCTQAEVKQTVRRFVAAFNRGQARALEVVWARKPDFKWYATGPPGVRLQTAATYRPSLIPYFLSRHRRGERLQLLSLQVNGNAKASKPYGNFQYRLSRSADDLPATAYHGKGALHCYGGRPDELIVWAMAEAPTS
jgi:hypothetical protein